MEKLKESVEKSFSINDLCIKLYGYTNGRTIKKVNKLIQESGLDISHFGLGKKLTKYKKITKKCPICDSDFETKEGKKDEKYTCSYRCSNQYFQHGVNNPDFDKEKYEDRYRKVSNKLKENKPWNKGMDGERDKICLNCKNEYKTNKKNQIYCSKQCQFKSVEYKEKLRINVNKRIEEGTHKGWQSRNIESYPEKFFKNVLKNNNIEYEFNKLVIKKDLGIDEIGNYFLDFYIKNGNIDLEIDGNQHKYRKNHDSKRDEHLSNKFNVYRIEWKSINNESGKQYIKNEIDKFINYYNNMTTTTQQQPQQQITRTD